LGPKGRGRIARVIRAQTRILRRIPEAMDPDLYYLTFRSFIGLFEGIGYEDVSEQTRLGRSV
jgi:indoleamine 2,3-dioxygenase